MLSAQENINKELLMKSTDVLLDRYFIILRSMLNSIKLCLLKLKPVLPYFLSITICCIVSFIYAQYLFKSQKEHVMLKAYMHDISNALTRDFKNALNNNFEGFWFFDYFDGIKSPKDTHINVVNNNITILTPAGLLVFNQQTFKNFINYNLPPYVNYQMSFNGVNITRSPVIHINADTKGKYHINQGNDAVIKLGINTTHPTYTRKILSLYLNVLTFLGASLFISITLLHLYLKQRIQLKARINELEDDLSATKQELEAKITKTEQEKAAILLQHRAEQRLRRILIQKATEIYVHNTAPNISDKYKHSPQLSNLLFPITFTDIAYDEEIDVDKLTNDLNDYLAYESTKVHIKINKEAERIKIPCSTPVFYQILFSLISNLLRLMPIPSSTTEDAHKNFIITLAEEKIIIDYETFPLNNESINTFLSKKGLDKIDAFFLDYKRILESFKNHNIEYHTSSNTKGNKFEISFKKPIAKGPPKLRIVE